MGGLMSSTRPATHPAPASSISPGPAHSTGRWAEAGLLIVALALGLSGFILTALNRTGSLPASSPAQIQRASARCDRGPSSAPLTKPRGRGAADGARGTMPGQYMSERSERPTGSPTPPSARPSVDGDDLDEAAILARQSRRDSRVQGRQQGPGARREVHEVEVRDLTVSDEPADIDGRSGQ